MSENTIYIGCDNGISGGISFFKPATNNLVSVPMPIIKTKSAKGLKSEYDLPAIINLLKQYKDIKIAILERAQAFPGQGVVSQFSIGRNYGMMEALLTALEIPYQITHSKSWQKKMFEGINHQDTKQASALVAQRLFPGFKFYATDQSSKIHSGMTDSALMAVYGSIIYGK